MTHSEHMKTFIEIQSHLKMEEEPLKTFSSSNALVVKGNRPRNNKNRGRVYKKVPHPYQKNGPKSSAIKKQKTKGNDEKNIARVKCYNCGKRATMLGIVLSLLRYLCLLILINCLFVPMH